MATLPEGRKPLTDGDMVILLYDIARAFGRENSGAADQIRETADRFQELVTQNKQQAE